VSRDGAMPLAEAQREMRRGYRGGLHGQLVSAALWAASAACGTWGSHQLAEWVLVIGGFLIWPLTALALRLAGGGPPGRANPLNVPGMLVAFTLPPGLPAVLTLAHFAPRLFFPAMLLLVGAHYLPFVFLYGTRLWLLLVGAMLACGYTLGWVAPQGFATGGWVGAALLAAYAVTGWRHVVGEERRAA